MFQSKSASYNPNPSHIESNQGSAGYGLFKTNAHSVSCDGKTTIYVALNEKIEHTYVHIKFDHFFRLKFHNFVIKQNLIMKVMVLVLDTIGYLMQFTKLV